jgi:hypothetical protein
LEKRAERVLLGNKGNEGEGGGGMYMGEGWLKECIHICINV